MTSIGDFWVYSIYAEDRLLYVGLTQRPVVRLANHRSRNTNGLWDQKPTRFEWLHIGFNEAKAREIEKQMIRELDPPFNVAWRKGWQPTGGKKVAS